MPHGKERSSPAPRDTSGLQTLTRALGRSSVMWIVAIALISITVAIFTFVETSRGFDRFIAQTEARKTARQTLVAILEEEAALRPYDSTGSAEAAVDYRRARAVVTGLTSDLRRDVAPLAAPVTATAFANFERANDAFGAELDTTLQRKPAEARRVPDSVFREIATSRKNLTRLVGIFNVAGAKTVAVTKRRILIGGLVSVGSTLLLGAAALTMETLRRRLQRRRAREQAANLVEREKADAAAIRADTLEAGRVVLEREIAERERVEERLAFAAFHDELTGLPNRALFMDRLTQMVARLQRRNDHLSAVLFVDLDRFKLVNDSLGHMVGDLLLIAVARRLEPCLRAGDTLARLGGDEFTILLDDVDDALAACTIAERVLRALDLPFSFSGHEVFASASIGIAVSRTGYDRPEDVLRDADIAMYRAKERGKGRYEMFAPELLSRAIGRLEVQTDLRRALERDEFRLLYQPIVSLPSGRIAGFEALVRWLHPQRGLLGPDEFISVAEETGAIVPIGEWVMRAACGQMRAWRQAFGGAAGVRINVNVSAKQLASPGFPDLVERILAESGLAADGVNLEITESVIMENPDAARATLAALREMGLGVQLDDFGTGYSSLAYLHHFPIDALKIDRSFISRSGVDVANPEIVGTILALARSLSIEATIEGIETEQQLAQLQKMGCTAAQGYYFSRPIDAATAAALLGTQFAATSQFASLAAS